MFSAKLRPGGRATPNRGPPDVQDQRVGNKEEGECCTSRRCQVRGRRYGAGCCGREQCWGALRVARRGISSLETERVKLSRGASTSRRPKGGNCGAVIYPHCGPEVTRRQALKTSRAAAERTALRHAAAGGAEGPELRGALLTKGAVAARVDLDVTIAGRRGFPSAARGLIHQPASPGRHPVDEAYVGGGRELATVGPTDCALLIDKVKTRETCRYTSCNPVLTATGSSNTFAKCL